MKCEAIHKLRNEFPVIKMCEVLGIKPNTYYRWIKQEQTRRAKRIKEQTLINKIEKIFHASDKTYGYRVILAELMSQGEEVSEYKVRKIMHENGFYPETVRKYKPCHNGKTDGKYKENVVKQQFFVEHPNEVWAGDITYIKTELGWRYLAVVLDLFNREVVGYAISSRIDTELVRTALGNAIARHKTGETIVFHSDRGSQYASQSYQRYLEEHGIVGSMSRPGCPYDNSCVESFFATLKKERIYRRHYETEIELRQDMFKYVELFYNRKRRHSYLGYKSPVEYRNDYERNQAA